MFMTESSSDTALGDQLRQGNEQSLAEMFLKHGERFRRIIHFRMDDRLHGRVDPDDVLQEAYLAAAKRLDHFAQSDISAFVWLRLIVGQTLIDIHRRHIGAQARDAGREIPIHGMGGGKTTSASRTCGLSIARRFPRTGYVEQYGRLHHCLHQLPRWESWRPRSRQRY
jgi:RNA polymerase sigma-70 factor, ECF subfamily